MLPALVAGAPPAKPPTAKPSVQKPADPGLHRRLTRIEYENTVRDLLGIDADLKQLLPDDSRTGGFDTSADASHISSFLLDRYLQTAQTALNAAIANRPQPPTTKKVYSYKDEFQVNHEQNRFLFRKLDDAVVFFSSTYSPTVLSQFYPRAGGKYRFRISTYAFQSPGKPVTYRVDAGEMSMTGKPHVVGFFDAQPDKPTVLEFTDRINPEETIKITPYGTGTEHDVNRAGSPDKYTGAGIAVQWVEVEGPLNDTWPPESHQRLFGDLPQQPVRNTGMLEVRSADPAKDADRILRAFIPKAFRRPVTEAELQPYLKLAQTKLTEGRPFEQAVRVALTAVLISPDFLYLRAAPGKLDDITLANRLAYFLWSTMPDEELLAIATSGKLGQPKTLDAQIDRMLNHPRAQAFTENFAGQWLGLRDIDFTEPSFHLYPEYDEMLKVSMLKETTLFFAEILKNDLSITNFIASDFSMLNGRLARHYGVPGAEGWTFKKVPLPPGSHRGGLLTMGSILKITANGTSTSPVIRGAWVQRNILGTPPPPPPPNVPAVEPDIRGATTIREQLAKHRTDPACAGCHKLIDPAGFALESFDVIGGWREHYRSTGNGKEVVIDGRRMPYLQGPKVDPSDSLPDGRKFKDIDELKQLLLKDRDQLARALAVKLLTYGTGAEPAPADTAAVEGIVKKVRERNYGLRSLVHAVVQSDPFRRRRPPQ